MTNFEQYTFDNGFRLAWKPTDSKTIFSNLKVNHGALHEREGEEGIAHFLEHMLCEGGTSKYTPEKQAEIRGTFGFTNAFTSRRETTIPGGIISSDFGDYLEMVSQMVFSPKLDAKVLEQQKKVVLSEISRTKGAPNFEDIERFFRPSMTKNSRDRTYFVLGNEEVIQNVTEDQLRSFHSRGYNPNNMILMLAGNLPGNLVDKVGEYFGNKPRGEGSPIVLSKIQPLEHSAVRYSSAPDLLNKDNPEESNSRLLLATVVPDEFHEDSSVLSVTSEIFGNSWTTGLKKRIRSDEGMSYDIGSGYSGDQNYGYFEISGKVHSIRQEKAIDIVFEEIAKLKENRLSEDEVLRAKKRVSYGIANNVGGPVSIDPINVTEVARIDYAFDERPSIEKMLTEVERVTPEDVQRVANLYLPSDRKNGKYVMLVRDPLKK
jgi:predicted Zn-dependent peptidase